MILLPLVFGFGVLLAQSAPPTAASDDLAAAKSLYASADYTEALARLANADTGPTADDVNQYRALCLLALGRTPEAQRSIERLVNRRPLFKISDADVSPRLVAMFHEVRKRLLPGAARNLYAKARASFEEKNYPAAEAQLKELQVFLADDDVADDTAALGDLKMLGEGFLKLTESELAAAASKAATAAPKMDPGVPPAPQPARATVDQPDRKVYSDTDEGVSAPVDIVRTIPAWHPPNAMAQRLSYHGVLKVVIDERGKVESAVLVQPVAAAYDPMLLEAAKHWEFRPALKDGQAVKYERLFTFTLSPR